MVTADTNIAFYALTNDAKTDHAEQILGECDFLSVQVLNEYAWAARRKAKRTWVDIVYDLELLQQWVGDIQPVHIRASQEALRLAMRYQLAYYDAVLIAVALAGGATTFYSEDMQHGLVIDDRLTILNPFRDIP